MKGAIFDVDGTLLDSMKMWYELVVRFYDEHGVHADADEAFKYMDMTLEESIPIITKELGLDMTFDEILDCLKRMAADYYRESVPLKDGAAEYMRKLHSEGVKIAIATSGYEELCKAAFTRLGVWDLIDARAYSAEVGVNKSNPDIYLLAAERLGVEPADCTVYEDIAVGIEGAKKGGFMTCAVYDDSNRDDTELLQETADRYITGWRELIQ